MKQLTLLFSFLCFSINAQNNYEKGKIVTDDGTIINSYIGVYSWEKFPDELDYKIDLTSNKESISSSLIKAVYLDNGVKFFKRTIEVDISSNNPEKLDDKFQIESEIKTIFLRQLVEGSANLYIYSGIEKPIFFYETIDQKLEQLESKRYLVSLSKINYNKNYLLQLQKYVSCNKEKKANVRYSINSLTNYFQENNKCNGDESSEIVKVKSPLVFKVILGVNSSKLTTENRILLGTNSLDFQNKISLVFGLEIEGPLPSKTKDYFSPFFLATTRSYKTTEEIRFVDFDINYFGMELTPGMRYYINLKKQNYLFTDIGLVVNFKLSETIDSAVFSDSDEGSFFENNKPSFAFGVGYKINKFSIALKYYLPIHFEGDNDTSPDSNSSSLGVFESLMTTLSLRASYDLF
jgi:hypothetical protein